MQTAIIYYNKIIKFITIQNNMCINSITLSSYIYEY